MAQNNAKGGGPPTGIASGDLSGNYPNPEVTGLLNNALPSLVDGYLYWSGSAWQLLTISSGSFSPPITYTNITKTTTYTIHTSDFVILCDTSGGAWTLTLPTVVNGQTFIIKDVKGTFESNNLTLARSASEKIEGVAASKVLSTNWGYWVITNNGTDWFIIG